MSLKPYVKVDHECVNNLLVHDYYGLTLWFEFILFVASDVWPVIFHFQMSLLCYIFHFYWFNMGSWIIVTSTCN